MTDVDVPAYDPAVHTVEGDNPLVRVGLWCSCGGVHKQIDPVSLVLPQIADFRERHSGSGHKPSSPTDSAAEREARREAGFRAAGRQDEFEPKPRDVTDEPAFDWTPPPVVEPVEVAEDEQAGES